MSHILVVEDEAIIRNAVRRLLTRYAVNPNRALCKTLPVDLVPLSP